MEKHVAKKSKKSLGKKAKEKKTTDHELDLDVLNELGREKVSLKPKKAFYSTFDVQNTVTN